MSTDLLDNLKSISIADVATRLGLKKGQNRFQRMKESHPKHYQYCIEKLGIGSVLDIIGVEK